jgi:hypothetical protein
LSSDASLGGGSRQNPGGPGGGFWVTWGHEAAPTLDSSLLHLLHLHCLPLLVKLRLWWCFGPQHTLLPAVCFWKKRLMGQCVSVPLSVSMLAVNACCHCCLSLLEDSFVLFVSAQGGICTYCGRAVMMSVRGRLAAAPAVDSTQGRTAAVLLVLHDAHTVFTIHCSPSLLHLASKGHRNRCAVRSKMQETVFGVYRVLPTFLAAHFGCVFLR